MSVTNDLNKCSSLRLINGIRPILRTAHWTIMASLAAVLVLSAASCGTMEAATPSTANNAHGNVVPSVEVRAEALAALKAAEAWRVETTLPDGWLQTEWWAANSGDYRLDQSFDDKMRSSLATDGQVLVALGSDGYVVEQPLKETVDQSPTPTPFTTYYSYLIQDKPISVDVAPSGGVLLVLADAPSSLAVRLSEDSHLPLEFSGTSELNGAGTTFTIEMSPISLQDLKEATTDAISELRQTPPPTYPDVTSKDHLVNALRAAGVDCRRADVYVNPEGETLLELSIQAPVGKADHTLAEEAATLVRAHVDLVPADSVKVHLLSAANEYYEESFVLE